MNPAATTAYHARFQRVLRHIDEHPGEDLSLAALRYLYADWLPRSAEEPRDFSPYPQRVTFFPDVPEGEAVTDIFLPLA